MKNIRIGNDIAVVWSLMRDGQPYNLEGKPLALYLDGPLAKTRIQEFNAVGNQIQWHFNGSEQKVLGKYSLVLVINEGNKGMITTDICDIVCLVGKSCMASGSDGENLKTEVIELTSEINFASIDVDNELSSTSTNPVENKVITAALEKKVSKEPGKGLSSNDFTNEEKQKLAGLENYNDAEIKQDIYSKLDQKANKSELTELSEEIVSFQNEKIPLTNNRFFNAMDVAVGNVFIDEYGSEGSGVACKRLSVREGEIYKLVGRGNAYAYKGYWLVDRNNVVTRMIGDVESYNVELTISANESILYVNCVNYNESVDGITRTQRINKIDELHNDIGLLSSQVEELGTDIKNVGNLEFSETISLNDKIVDGYAFNLGAATIGGYFTNEPDACEGYAYLRVLVNPANVYKIKGVGSPYAFRFFAFLDKDYKVLDVSSADYNTRNEPLELHPPQDAAILIINFSGYNAFIDGAECMSYYSIKGINDLSKEGWKGKNIVTFGDSITQFEDSNFMSYPDWLQHYTNANVVNVGIGGTQLRARTSLTSSPSNDIEAYAGLDIYSLVSAATTKNFSVVNACANYVQTRLSPMYSVIDAVQRLQSVDWGKVDAIVFFAGTNDWYNGDDIGSEGSKDEHTTLGAINKIIELIGSAYPHIQIYWFTPIVRYIGDNWVDQYWGGTMKVNGFTLTEVVDAIKKEVERNNIPICDMYRTLGWNQYNFKYYFNSGDGIHPNRGLRFIAQKVMSFLEANKTFL